MCKKKKVRKQVAAVRCQCGAAARKVDGSVVHGENNWGGELYICSRYPECDSYVGVNKQTGKPLGTLADAKLRRLRIETHRLFDQIWKQGIMNRNDAYRWIRDRYGMRGCDAHIAQFSEYMCRSLMSDCQRTLRNHRIAC